MYKTWIHARILMHTYINKRNLYVWRGPLALSLLDPPHWRLSPFRVSYRETVYRILNDCARVNVNTCRDGSLKSFGNREDRLAMKLRMHAEIQRERRRERARARGRGQGRGQKQGQGQGRKIKTRREEVRERERERERERTPACAEGS